MNKKRYHWIKPKLHLLTVSVSTNLWNNGDLKNLDRHFCRSSSKWLFTSWYSAIKFGLDFKILMIFSMIIMCLGLNCAKNLGKCINWPATFVPSTIWLNVWHCIKLFRSSFFLFNKGKMWNIRISMIFSLNFD